MYEVFVFQSMVTAAVSISLFILKAWAFVDSLTRRKEEYVAADKLTKPAWTIILGVSLAAHMLFWDPINLLGIIGTIAAIVYLVDVRPAIRSLTRR